ncbi:hypothetical protein, partial [Cellulomonas sp.]|uniref:hypothetical protein n=1 Tax=Cellulomonas sp. TaxID=40001 RepID=UPI001AFE8F17
VTFTEKAAAELRHRIRGALSTTRPSLLTAAALARTYLSGTGRRRPVWSVPLVLRATPYRDNGHLAREHAVGRTTFAEWVQQRHGSPSA